MPVTTSADEESGFMGLTVVLALRNEKTPIAATTNPIATVAAAKTCRAGQATSRDGTVRATNHINAPVTNTTATGGTFKSKVCINQCAAP